MISSNSLSLLTIITLFITVLVQSEDLTTPKENQTRPLKRVNRRKTPKNRKRIDRRRGKNIKRNTSGFQLIESSCQKLNNLER
ncbi:unnamed protein product [Schistosoma turkestanicum]|nr:unnamed protein product [Schistosoma turkestanicum]